MRISIMQPYFFPRASYWRLIGLSDTFVILDDVNYINRGWINRNRITNGSQISWMSIPLSKSSQNKLINSITLTQENEWRRKMLTRFGHYYNNFEYAHQSLELLSNCLDQNELNLADFLSTSIRAVCTALLIDTKIVRSSELHRDRNLHGEEQIISICNHLSATEYINPVGGKHLYNTQRFKKEGLNLTFLEDKSIDKDLCPPSFPKENLSILDSIARLSINKTIEVVKTF